MDGGAWWATVHGVTKSRTQLSDFTSLLLQRREKENKKETHFCLNIDIQLIDR